MRNLPLSANRSFWSCVDALKTLRRWAGHARMPLTPSSLLRRSATRPALLTSRSMFRSNARRTARSFPSNEPCRPGRLFKHGVQWLLVKPYGQA